MEEKGRILQTIFLLTNSILLKKVHMKETENSIDNEQA